MKLKEDTPGDHQRRSEFMQRLIQGSSRVEPPLADYITKIPRTIVQFWHNRTQLPTDVMDCIESWKSLEALGFKHSLFDQDEAKEFISEKLGERHSSAFEKCYHPAMQSDYFRLCYIFIEGGCYVDVDDIYLGSTINYLFSDGRLKIQPLCYDKATGLMVEPSVFTAAGAYSPTWIFYFNNNPLIAPPNHLVVDRALMQATILLENSVGKLLPEIQSTTGPGNLSKSIFELAADHDEIKASLFILSNWVEIAATKWHLSYRFDTRNWRLSNQKWHQE